MTLQDHQFIGAGNLPLFARVWEPDSEARAFVLITHGHGEHGGRYTYVAESLVARNFAVAAMDLRGHGLSGGPRGLIMSWDEFREDLRLLIESLDTRFSTLPKILYGHSLGGTISLDFCLRYKNDIVGVIVSAPVLSQPNIPAYLFIISRLLSKVYPTFSLATKLDSTALSRDPEIVRAYREDPLVHSVGRARMGTELVETAEWIQAHAHEWELPLLVIQGGQDRLVNPEDSKQFFENVRVVDKTYLEFPSGFHESHNDLDKAVVLQRVGDWIEALSESSEKA